MDFLAAATKANALPTFSNMHSFGLNIERPCKAAQFLLCYMLL